MKSVHTGSQRVHKSNAPRRSAEFQRCAFQVRAKVELCAPGIDTATLATKVCRDAMLLRARQFEFQFPRPTLVMGIVNVTPDSFSDGGRFFDSKNAIEHAWQLVAEGADIIDIGGESTRPNAVPVSEEEELRRVLPVIVALASKNMAIPVSIDTMKPGVARAAVEAGASIINDIGANRSEVTMWQLARETGAGYVLMHMQGTPQTMQREPRYADVVRDVATFYDERLSRLAECGVSPEQLILDPGLGFGKTLEHNLELLAGLRHFRTYQRPVLVGASRKAFIGQVTEGKSIAERLPGSLVCAVSAAQDGAQMIRTHDVAATRQALRMMEAIQAKRK
ncbi:MAG TPA: dihydropteroate synthase [Methylomirabilota bacterium]|nr:dihydropteroate synthase [Methylomirabilota bacterium]